VVTCTSAQSHGEGDTYFSAKGTKVPSAKDKHVGSALRVRGGRAVKGSGLQPSHLAETGEGVVQTNVKANVVQRILKKDKGNKKEKKENKKGKKDNGFPKLKFSKKGCNFDVTKQAYKAFQDTQEASAKCEENSNLAIEVVDKTFEVIEALEKLPENAKDIRKAVANFNAVLQTAGKIIGKIPRMKIVVVAMTKAAQSAEKIAGKINDYGKEIAKVKEQLEVLEKSLNAQALIAGKVSGSLLVAGEATRIAVGCAAALEHQY